MSADPTALDPTTTSTHARRPEPPRPTVPGYDILGELGRGGMGVVYRAVQLHAGREVALKMVLAGEHAGASELLRFRTEAEAVARLQHPHIVAVYEVGEHAGRPFFSMEHCPGGSLVRRLADGPLSSTAAAELVRKVARGVAAAHAAGIVHRDLKPGNVLLTADGEPKVADFGCAKVSGAADRHVTSTGAVIGTPAYMAPEQAGGKKHVGPPADVYALGAILYESLSGRPPFSGPTPTDVLIQVLADDPIPLRELNSDVPRDLDAVVRRCLSKQAEERYQTAADLADDLGRFVAGEPVSAARTGLIAKLVGAVDRVQLQQRFAGYGGLLLALAPLMLLSEVMVTVVGNSPFSDPWTVVGRGVQGVLFVLLVGHFRRWNFRPGNPAERQLWAVWGGYLLACFAYGLSGWAMVGMTMEAANRSYSAFACLTALAFFTLAPSFWGYCWLIGGGFVALAFVMLVFPPAAPLEFGVTWAAVLVAMGLRLRALAKDVPAPTRQDILPS